MKYFNLYSNILITPGINRILISDLQRNDSELHALELYDIIEELKKYAIEEVFSFYDEKSRPMAQEYLDFLIEKEFGFITDNNWDKNFLPLEIEFKEAGKISNLFIEIIDLKQVQKLAASIENLSIRHLVIYCQNSISLIDFLALEETFDSSCLESIEIFSSFHAEIDENFIKSLSDNTKRIYSLIFYNCETAPFGTEKNLPFELVFTKQHLQINSCGKVSIEYFDTNITKVLEAINHNSCLHKKIGIDIHGNIKNCPAMPQSFGNINQTTLEQALAHPNFKDYWNLTKEEIETCKDCEFRNICTDCRAYTEQTHFNQQGLDISKPLKCGYNPYTSEWEEWSTNPLKSKAIKHYGMQLVKYEA